MRAAAVGHRPAIDYLPLLERHTLRLVPLWLPLLILLIAETSPAAVTTTAQVTLLRNQEYGEALLKGIRSARSSILCSFYLFKAGDLHGNVPRSIADELVGARRRGVNVKVYLEKNNRGEDLLNNDNRNTARLLHRGGVEVIFDSVHTTTHTKAVVIDSRYVFIGSHNLTQGALSRNNELSVVIDSPDMALEVKEYLDRL